MNASMSLYYTFMHANNIMDKNPKSENKYTFRLTQFCFFKFSVKNLSKIIT